MKSSASRRSIGAAALLALLAATALPGTAGAQADALKVRQLEQDVRDLRRTVELQQRRLDELERAAGRGGRTAGTAAARVAPVTSVRDAPWLQAANWERVVPGLGELEVVSLLGPPTSMRAAPDGRARTLFYALEIGSSGFLGGHVVVEDRRVVAVELPRLR
jgi:ABC-type amino acid transport substrate-binding protein